MPRAWRERGGTKAAEPLSARVKVSPIHPKGERGADGAAREGYTKLTAVPLHGDTIWAVENFLSASECSAWVAHAERAGFEETRLPATRETAFRAQGRLALESPAVAHALWARMRALVPTGVCDGVPVGCYENIRLYRYGPGQRFGKHVDQSTDAADGITGVTALVYLSEVDGGETAFYNDRDRVVLCYKPKIGSLLLHGHGDKCLTHEARAVRSGVKYVLRTDVVYEAESAMR